MSLVLFFFFFFNDTATTEIYTLSLHDALPISGRSRSRTRWALCLLYEREDDPRFERAFRRWLRRARLDHALTHEQVELLRGAAARSARRSCRSPAPCSSKRVGNCDCRRRRSRRNRRALIVYGIASSEDICGLVPGPEEAEATLRDARGLGGTGCSRLRRLTVTARRRRAAASIESRAGLLSGHLAGEQPARLSVDRH